jgi:putative acetyltransferase
METKPPYFIRPATQEDIPAIKDLVFSVLREYDLKPDEEGRDQDLGDLDTHYFNGNGYFGVVVNENTNDIIGTFGLHRASPSTFELRKMYLLKDSRGKGIGRTMLRTAIAIAIEKNCKKIVLETISPLKEAIALYQKYGFKEIEPHEVSDRVDRAFELVL